MIYEKLNQFFYKNLSEWSDIQYHLPILKEYASKCKHITEFGTRTARSTSAFLSGCTGKVVSYDIQRTPEVDFLLSIDLPCEWQFVLASTVDPSVEINETELLFIDTWHSAAHVEQELRLHGHKASKYIAFHDTESQGEWSVDEPGALGINHAVRRYMQENPQWKKVYETPINNGLLIVERERTTP